MQSNINNVIKLIFCCQFHSFRIILNLSKWSKENLHDRDTKTRSIDTCGISRERLLVIFGKSVYVKNPINTSSYSVTNYFRIDYLLLSSGWKCFKILYTEVFSH